MSIIEPPLSDGSSEIDGNCDILFILDEFLITTGSFFFSFIQILFLPSCILLFFFQCMEVFIGRADGGTWKQLIRLLSRRLGRV